MKTNEVMVGDWIRMYGQNDNMFSELHWYNRKITHDWIDCLHRQEQTDNHLKENGITLPHPQQGDTEPLPLTIDILKLNGFEYKESDETAATESYHHWQLEGHNFYLVDKFWWGAKTGELDVYFGIAKISYVHEIQHALRLCGLHDVADNFKVEK